MPDRQLDPYGSTTKKLVMNTTYQVRMEGDGDALAVTDRKGLRLDDQWPSFELPNDHV